jgi:hypothetical protein
VTAPPAAERCAARALAAGEPLEGSAPRAHGWVALEQDGPWGAKAFTASHLDPEVGRALETAAALAGVRPCLVRTPGRHADRHVDHPRRVLVSHGRPGHGWLLTGCIDDPAELLALDWAAVARGDRDAVRSSLPGLATAAEHHLLVCTNGTRDVCCAAVGRPVATGAAAARPGRVWEVTHTSGHRFAPTAVLLPAGTLHGRLTVETAVALLDEATAGRTVVAGSRGRSSWPPPGQVAELAVRRETGLLGLDDLTVVPAPDLPDHWRVVARDGRRWRVRVVSAPSGTERPESCGKAALPLHRYVAEVPVEETTGA